MATRLGVGLAERGLVPDPLIRLGIRRLLAQRLRRNASDPLDHARQLAQFVSQLSVGPIAESTGQANEQHYEVPPPFFERILGPYLKYSCGLWPSPHDNLASSERNMLALTCQRAEVADGMRILDLGCGWGSLSRWILENYPRCHVVAVSNSHAQRQYIEDRTRDIAQGRLQVITRDINDLRFESQPPFDRIISVEMMEHVRNYHELLHRMAYWICKGGKVFVHIFCHRTHPYFFEDHGTHDWMSRHFFTGGIMPSWDLLAQFPDDLTLVDAWQIDGNHYARTCEAWLHQADMFRDELTQVLRRAGYPQPHIQWQRWRIFFLACAELFAYHQGQEWFVGHFLLRPTRHIA